MPMTSHERLMAAYRKQEPDRVPVRVWAVDDRTQPIHPSYAPIVEAAREKTDLVGGWGVAPAGRCCAALRMKSVPAESRNSKSG